MKARILLIEDSPVQAEAVVGPLQERGYDVTWAESGVLGLRIASDIPPDCILLDVQLPDLDGFSICRVLASRDVTRDIPIIMLTSRGSVPDRIRGLETGAADYLAKPFDLGELEARIVSCLRTRELQRELRVKNQQLEDLLTKFRILASTDELTGLFNRRRFFEELDREISRCQRYGSNLALLIIDADDFKHINDAYGHQAGDEVLRSLGKLLGNSFRRTDIVARYGGEEFAILLPETDLREAVEVADRFRQEVQAGVCIARGVPIPVTISAGVAVVTPETASAETLIRAADAALYRAKAAGRNRVESAQPVGT
jgi:diguanylate cyclase (GGDEF)-like protein